MEMTLISSKDLVVLTWSNPWDGNDNKWKIKGWSTIEGRKPEWLLSFLPICIIWTPILLKLDFEDMKGAGQVCTM